MSKAARRPWTANGSNGLSGVRAHGSVKEVRPADTDTSGRCRRTGASYVKGRTARRFANATITRAEKLGTADGGSGRTGVTVPSSAAQEAASGPGCLKYPRLSQMETYTPLATSTSLAHLSPTPRAGLLYLAHLCVEFSWQAWSSLARTHCRTDSDVGIPSLCSYTALWTRVAPDFSSH